MQKAENNRASPVGERSISGSLKVRSAFCYAPCYQCVLPVIGARGGRWGGWGRGGGKTRVWGKGLGRGEVREGAGGGG